MTTAGFRNQDSAKIPVRCARLATKSSILNPEMSWLRVMLKTDAGSVDALTDQLLIAGALSVDVTDADAGTPRERELFVEPEVAGVPSWETATISALFDESIDVSACVAEALRAAGLDAAREFEIERVADRDWVRATQSQFHPLRVSRRLWVVPTWHTPPDPAAINLIIDPGLAFGTGAHATTRLCLNWLDRNLRGGESVLDYGCGSGILAIAALKLGAAHAIGVDIDSAALLAARHNAMQNQSAAQFESADRAVSAAYDVVLANILASPLKLLAPLFARATHSGGRIVLSGILESQSDEVRASYRDWFDMGVTEHDEGWVLLSGLRK
jgi:ribosomal protein L11 methyltransferase